MSTANCARHCTVRTKRCPCCLLLEGWPGRSGRCPACLVGRRGSVCVEVFDGPVSACFAGRIGGDAPWKCVMVEASVIRAREAYKVPGLELSAGRMPVVWFGLTSAAMLGRVAVDGLIRGGNETGRPVGRWRPACRRCSATGPLCQVCAEGRNGRMSANSQIATGCTESLTRGRWDLRFHVRWGVRPKARCPGLGFQNHGASC